VAFLQLKTSFRPRFSKYSKPKSGIGPGSLKTGAKEGYRPRSSRTRSQKVAGSQGYRPRSKETRCQKGVNGFSSSNNRSHRIYLGFKIHKAFFLPAPPLQFHFLSLREALPSLSLSSSFTVRIPRRRADGMVVVTDTGAGNGSVFALADAMEVLVAVADLHSVEDRSNLASVRLQVQTVLLLLRCQNSRSRWCC